MPPRSGYIAVWNVRLIGPTVLESGRSVPMDTSGPNRPVWLPVNLASTDFLKFVLICTEFLFLKKFWSFFIRFRIVSEIPDEHFERLTSEEKWKRIFKSAELPNLYILVSKLLSSNIFLMPNFFLNAKLFKYLFLMHLYYSNILLNFPKNILRNVNLLFWKMYWILSRI